jgi:N-methylhydantoinase A/oxoprolinase/acetone carboxylase beta subunit
MSEGELCSDVPSKSDVADIALRTNTDGVILDLARSSDTDRGIVAWKKTSTTKNPNDGINNVIKAMFEQSDVDPRQIASVTIGTTHFINSVVERDSTRLAKVGVIRLCGPFSKDIAIGIDWPPELREIICGYRGIVDGGLEIDGSLIAELDIEEVKRQAEEIKSQGISSIAIVGIFSPIDIVYKQEETAAEIIRQVYPEADVVCSKDVANIGFLERENAAILNASILPFARRTIRAFQRAIQDLQLDCPVFVTQNDGTLLHASAAAKLPIRTFSSGPTNSMRGAAFLMQGQAKEAMMVIDVGGTTTDVGLLEKNGFPRQAAAYSEISGVRTNFSYPDVRSIGLGGGSIVKRNQEGKLVVGPESVGYRITEKALVFGGDIATTTDYTVLGDSSVTIGDRTKLEGASLSADLPEFKEAVKSMLERIVDQMKTSPDDIPVVLVGGGAIVAPESLQGASKVVKPNWSGIANAIGAATARISGVIDSVENTDTRTKAQITEELSQRAIDAAVQNGALRETVSIAEMDSFPLQYIANKSRMIVKAVGSFDYSRTDLGVELADALQSDGIDKESAPELPGPKATDITAPTVETSISQTFPHTPEYVASYRPEVVDRQWLLSETDLEFISTGCYILGTGGGGSPYQHFLRLRELKRAGVNLRVISPHDLKDDDLVACGGGKGSPQVSIEKPYGDELVIRVLIIMISTANDPRILESQRELYALLNVAPSAVIPLEIGGGNGLQGLIIGASTNMDIPALDADLMGRAASAILLLIISCAPSADCRSSTLFPGRLHPWSLRRKQ